MPKAIEQVEIRLIDAGRQILLEKGYEAFTMRAVAEACGIGLGTVYNYFKNKSVLISNILLKDWEEAEKRMARKIDMNTEALTRAEILYEELLKFTETFHYLWSRLSDRYKIAREEADYHDMVIGRLSKTAGVDRFVVEILIYFALERFCAFGMLKPYIAKLLSE